jgi:hypothetical protein
LRLLQSRDPADNSALLQVDHTHGVVAELCNVELLPVEIDGEMIDPPFDIAQRYLRFNRQELSGRGLSRGGKRPQRNQHRVPEIHGARLTLVRSSTTALSYLCAAR